MEKLFQEEQAKQHEHHLPPGGDGNPRPETESEKVQRHMMERIHRHMPPEQAKPEMQKPDWIIGLGVEPLDPFVREHLGIGKDQGARVSFVVKELPAAAAGIEVNDIVLSANGKNITKVEDLRELVDQSGKEGRPISLVVVHQGERRSVAVVPKSTKPAEPPVEARPDTPRPERPFAEFAKRLERQEQQIEELQREVRRLRREPRKERNEDPDQDDE